MARIARVVSPGVPHHLTQRGNRRQQTFFCDDDYSAYIELMAEWCYRCGGWYGPRTDTHPNRADVSLEKSGLCAREQRLVEQSTADILYAPCTQIEKRRGIARDVKRSTRLKLIE
jgi:hypothetical protein